MKKLLAVAALAITLGTGAVVGTFAMKRLLVLPVLASAMVVAGSR
jgi:hypothetical protein